MKITDHLDPAHVFPDVDCADRKALLSMLVEHLADHLPANLDPERLVEDLEAHEVHCHSCVDALVAVPHLLLADLENPILAVARTRQPIVWEPTGELSVFLVFLLLSPERDRAQHIRMLARLTRISRECEFARRAADPDSPEALYSLIEEEDWRHI